MSGPDPGQGGKRSKIRERRKPKFRFQREEEEDKQGVSETRKKKMPPKKEWSATTKHGIKPERKKKEDSQIIRKGRDSKKVSGRKRGGMRSVGTGRHPFAVVGQSPKGEV